MATNAPERWWERDDLHYRDGRLIFGGVDVSSLASAAGTPLYLYHGERVRRNALRLRAALEAKNFRFKIFYAMKSNRYAPLLAFLKTTGLCGIDACSPQEMLLARQCGFREEEISYTGVSVSDEDLRILSLHPNVWINCDSISMIRRLGALCPGREIGIRINPNLGLGYESNALLRYSGDRTTKFGIYEDRFEEALEVARHHGLKVTGLHFHVGCGYLTPQLEAWEMILAACQGFIDRTPDLKKVNVGGGLGIPLTEKDDPLRLDLWSEILFQRFSSRNLELSIEPGDFLAKDAGILILEANSIERKKDKLFVGVNGGFNIHIEPAFYRLPLEPVPCLISERGQSEAPIKTTLAGNINEALDLLAEDVLLPPIEEGDKIAFLNAGGYGAAMSSNHCMRGRFSEYLIL